jgi:hypothetical protein
VAKGLIIKESLYFIGVGVPKYFENGGGMDTRLVQITNQWCKYGSPEKMTIHVKSTGETINLENGSVVTLSAEKSALLIASCGPKKTRDARMAAVTLTRNCIQCGKSITAQRVTKEYCSTRCRTHAKRRRAEARRSEEVQKVLDDAEINERWENI